MDLFKNSGLNIEVFENIFSSSDDIFERLEREIQYLPSDKSFIYVNGKFCKIPRQLAAYGNIGLSYKFSGLNVPCEPWTSLLLEIRNKVEQLCECSFNFVLINRYKDGEDCIGQHKDDEYDLKKDYPIASISLGETRKLIFKRPNFENVSIDLKDNTMLVMKAPTNSLWTHGIPRQFERKGVRLNLTFRQIVVNNKRKTEDTFRETNKKWKDEYKNSQSRGFFSLNDVPEGIYPIGEDVFLSRNVYRRKSLIHLRRYKKYGEIFYPTKEGITMDIHEFDVQLKSSIPEQMGQLFELDDKLGYSLDLAVLEGDRFKLTKRYDRPNGQETTTSIIISCKQWQQMKDHHDTIMELLIDDQMSLVDFKGMFLTWSKVCHLENEIHKSIPESWDVTLGTKHLIKLLKNVIIDLLIEKGNLIISEKDIGAILTSNEIKDCYMK